MSPERKHNCVTKEQVLLSLPAGSATDFARAEPYRASEFFVTSDPPGSQLGSGGGTAHLLVEGWRSDAATPSFASWIHQSRKLLIHGSGESRRLPAYAAPGKPLIPIPRRRNASGQRPDMELMDLQLLTYRRLLWHAPETYRVMVTCGDVLLTYGTWLPTFPDADVLILGLSASPEEAQAHGVMVCPAADPSSLAFFLQKPPAEKLRELTAGHTYYLDTGVWLLSERGLNTLMRKCAWDPDNETFTGGQAGGFDMYDRFGPALGSDPAEEDPEIAGLRCAVLPLPDGHFYHFGTGPSLLGSVGQLLSPSAQRRSFGHASLDAHTGPIIQNATVACEITNTHRSIWIENAHIGSQWELTQRHILTGIPPNDWDLALPNGTCLDIVPTRSHGMCVRFYGFEDAFRGELECARTLWLGRPAAEWFAARGIDRDAAGMATTTDIQQAPLFPALPDDELDAAFISWLIAEHPDANTAFRELWLSLPRLSCRQLLQETDVTRLARGRRAHMGRAATATGDQPWLDACTSLDLAATAELYVGEGWHPPPPPTTDARDTRRVHDHMFRAAMAARSGGEDASGHEQQAFQALQQMLVGEMEVESVVPRRNVLEDQIVWGRSPVRIDLAGGWTDTPPYCIEHGGKVVNVALDLNGQPPIQVFGRLTDRPDVVIRSIDLGIEDRISSYDELSRSDGLGSGFGIAKAALALAGLNPRFHREGGDASLEKQLRRELGGGIELSLLAAVPKGSGLGTSSILAATVLGTLSELLGFYWDTSDLVSRTLALEQMLTSGGGWQDQVGGIAPGLKLVETEPGPVQRPVIRWLPGDFFSGDNANGRVLLYYTGITRVAHGILGEIVKGLFLNAADNLSIIEEIGHNALFANDAIQRGDWEGLCEAIRRSWFLNQRLDSGTNPPEVQAILDRIEDFTAAAKLAGAGGGGYMLILAKDDEAARRLRQALAADPPNNRARFLDLSLSGTGFQVTRS